MVLIVGVDWLSWGDGAPEGSEVRKIAVQLRRGRVVGIMLEDNSRTVPSGLQPLIFSQRILIHCWKSLSCG